MKNIDPIVKDVRSAREKLFSMNEGDLNKLLDYFQEQEKLDKERLVKSINKKDNNKTDTGVG